MAQNFLGIGQAAQASAAQIAASTAATTAATAATGTNSAAQAANTAATRENAAAQAAHATASAQDTAAITADTTATNTNTASTNANAAAQRATGNIMQSYSGALKEAAVAKEAAAKSSGVLATAMGTAAAAGRGLLGVFGGLPGVAVMVLSNAKDIGTGIGEMVGKFALWATGQKSLEQSSKELEAAQKKEAEAAKAVAEAREKQAAADKAAADAKFGLNDRAKELITQFDDLIKKGDSASDAIGKIGKDFDLSTQPGIQAASGVLDKLAADGKITAQQFQDAWTQALDGVDLLKFDANFQSMLLNLEVAADKAGKAVEAAIARGASEEVIKALRLKAEQAVQAVQEAGKRLETMMDATLREAIRRTGLDMDLLAQGMGKAAASAINDVDILIGDLDALQAKGMDTGRILAASLSKAIDTADGEKALKQLKFNIEEVRNVLGDKIADGLLDQAKDKAKALKDELDRLTPGINSVAEAMKQLGVTSSAELKKAADDAKSAYDTIRTSGTLSANEVGQAFAAAAAKAIEANNGIAPSWVKSEAAVRGYRIETDAAGKQTLVSMKEAQSAIDSVAGAHRKAGSAAANHAMSVDELAKKYSDAGAQAKAASGQFLSAAKAQQDADTSKSSITNAPPPASQAVWNRSYIVDQLKQMGLDDETARKLSSEFVDNNGDVPYSNNAGQIKYGGKYGTLSEALYKAAYPYLFDDKGGKRVNEANKPPAPVPTPSAPAPVPPPAPRPTPAPVATPRPAPTGWDGNGGSASITAAPTYVSNISIAGIGKASARFDNPSEQAQMETLLRALTSAAGVAQ